MKEAATTMNPARLNGACSVTLHAAYRGLLLLTLLFFCSVGAPAQDTARTGRRPGIDTLGMRRTDEVRVDASSVLLRTTRDALPFTAITRNQIEAVQALDLSDVVAYVPGVFVKQYGGLGGLRTISLRGTSAQQTVFLVDGVRYRSGAGDAFDMSTIPADAIERVEVIRGGDAVLYGANALGGVVNIVTRARTDLPLAAVVRAGAGSFGEWRSGAGIAGASGGHSWQAGLHAVGTTGDYPFTFNEFGAASTVRRDNADMREVHGSGAWTLRGEDIRVTLAGNGFRAERGVPGAVVQGSREQLHARLAEGELSGTIALGYDVDGWSTTATASGRYNDLHYRDPDARVAGPAGIDNHYLARDAGLDLRARGTVGSGGVIDATARFGYASLRGDNLDPSAGQFVKRLEWSAAAMGSWMFEEGVLGNETVLEGGARLDLYSDIDAVASPSLGVVWRVGTLPLRVRAHAAFSFRAPSFTEQYYLNYGNRDLRPERGIGCDAGLTYEAGPHLAIEAGVFLLDVRDQIVSVPRSPVSWSAQNVARVLTRGVELGLTGTLLDGLLSGRLSYTRQRPEDRSEGGTFGKLLPYAPEELFNGVVELHLGPFSAGFTGQSISHRFSGPVNEYASMMPRYTLAGAHVAAWWSVGPVRLDARVECANLLAAEYQVVQGYPMPGRTGRVVMSVRYR